MGRVAQPWYRSSRDAWVIRQGGKMITLAKGKAAKSEAMRRWHEMQYGPPATGLSLGQLADEFLAWVGANREPETLRWYAWHVGALLARFGRQVAPEGIKTDAIVSWIEGNASWSRTTRHGAMVAAKRLYNWGRRKGLSANPLSGVELPGIQRRERIPTTAEVNELIDRARGPLRDFLAFMAETGCRASEAYRMQRRHVDFESGVCVMKGKTARATRRPRVIYLTAAAKRIALEYCECKADDDRLFMTSCGNPWDSQSVTQQVAQYRACLGLGPHVTAGGIRHWWITERLRAGVPIAHVAELAGHTSTMMISRHYSHLADHGDDLRRALEKRAG